jgi:hypothetical protein
MFQPEEESSHGDDDVRAARRRQAACVLAEEGRRNTEAGSRHPMATVQGWMQDAGLCALKAYLEYGINLREGMFK